MLNILAWLYCAFYKHDSNGEGLAEKRGVVCDSLVLNGVTQPSADSQKDLRKEKAIEKIEEYLLEKSWEAVNSDHASSVLLSSSDSANDSKRVLIDEDEFASQMSANDSQAVSFLGDDPRDDSYTMLDMNSESVQVHSPLASTPRTQHAHSDLYLEHNGSVGTGPAVSLAYADATDGNPTRGPGELPASIDSSNQLYTSNSYVRPHSPRMEFEIKPSNSNHDDATVQRERSDSWEKLDAATAEDKAIGRTKISIKVGGSPVAGQTVRLEPAQQKGRVHVTDVKATGVVRITHSPLPSNGTPVSSNRKPVVNTFKATP